MRFSALTHASSAPHTACHTRLICARTPRIVQPAPSSLDTRNTSQQSSSCSNGFCALCSSATLPLPLPLDFLVSISRRTHSQYCSRVSTNRAAFGAASSSSAAGATPEALQSVYTSMWESRLRSVSCALASPASEGACCWATNRSQLDTNTCSTSASERPASASDPASSSSSPSTSMSGEEAAAAAVAHSSETSGYLSLPLSMTESPVMAPSITEPEPAPPDR